MRSRAATGALGTHWRKAGAFEEFPNDLTAGQLRWAEIALEDAVAVAGEFHVAEVPWRLP